jgi:hypothetical protein
MHGCLERLPGLPSPLGPPAMTLLNAAYLGIERFTNERVKENWSTGSSQDDKTALIRAVYRQVLGFQYVP